MTDSNRQIDALLTEHFRYTPLTLIDDIINAVNTIVYRGIEAIENGLLNIPPQTLGFKPSSTATVGEEADYSAAQDEIENGVHQLETLLEATVDKAFDRFEIYTLRNILTVPADLVPWIRLAHYVNIPLPFDGTSSSTPESIQSLRTQLYETRKLNAALRAQQARNAALLTELRALLLSPNPDTSSSSSSHPENPESKSSITDHLSTSTSTSLLSPSPSSLAFLTDPSTPALPLSFSSAPTKPTLTPHAQFSASHLPALSSLVEKLRPRLKAIRELDATAVAGAGAGDGARGKKAERQMYLEGAAARAVNRAIARGKGDNAMTRDPASAVAGQEEGGARRGLDEVMELESLVGGLAEPK